MVEYVMINTPRGQRDCRTLYERWVDGEHIATVRKIPAGWCSYCCGTKPVGQSCWCQDNRRTE